jgi:hypothetical protein
VCALSSDFFINCPAHTTVCLFHIPLSSSQTPQYVIHPLHTLFHTQYISHCTFLHKLHTQSVKHTLVHRTPNTHTVRNTSRIQHSLTHHNVFSLSVTHTHSQTTVSSHTPYTHTHCLSQRSHTIICFSHTHNIHIPQRLIHTLSLTQHSHTISLTHTHTHTHTHTLSPSPHNTHIP